MKKKPKDIVVAALGGVRATARALGLTPGAVSKWRGKVPQGHHERLLEIAKEKRLDITAEMLICGA